MYIVYYIVDNSSASPPGMYGVRNQGLYVNLCLPPSLTHRKYLMSTGRGMEEWIDRRIRL